MGITESGEDVGPQGSERWHLRANCLEALEKDAEETSAILHVGC